MTHPTQQQSVSLSEQGIQLGQQVRFVALSGKEAKTDNMPSAGGPPLLQHLVGASQEPTLPVDNYIHRENMKWEAARRRIEVLKEAEAKSKQQLEEELARQQEQLLDSQMFRHQTLQEEQKAWELEQRQQQQLLGAVARQPPTWQAAGPPPVCQPTLGTGDGMRESQIPPNGELAQLLLTLQRQDETTIKALRELLAEQCQEGSRGPPKPPGIQRSLPSEMVRTTDEKWAPLGGLPRSDYNLGTAQFSVTTPGFGATYQHRNSLPTGQIQYATPQSALHPQRGMLTPFKGMSFRQGMDGQSPTRPRAVPTYNSEGGINSFGGVGQPMPPASTSQVTELAKIIEGLQERQLSGRSKVAGSPALKFPKLITDQSGKLDAVNLHLWGRKLQALVTNLGISEQLLLNNLQSDTALLPPGYRAVIAHCRSLEELLATLASVTPDLSLSYQRLKSNLVGLKPTTGLHADVVLRINQLILALETLCSVYPQSRLTELEVLSSSGVSGTVTEHYQCVGGFCRLHCQRPHLHIGNVPSPIPAKIAEATMQYFGGPAKCTDRSQIPPFASLPNKAKRPG